MGGKMDFTTKSGYKLLVCNASCHAQSSQERVGSLADEYLDTSLAYASHAAKPKSRLALVCEMVRY
jgi:hypothetical protein